MPAFHNLVVRLFAKLAPRRSVVEGGAGIVGVARAVVVGLPASAAVAAMSLVTAAATTTATATRHGIDRGLPSA